MLLRFGRLGYLVILAVIVILWTSVHERSREVIHESWKVVANQAFSQGSSFASDGVNTEVVPAAKGPSPYAYVFYATQDTYACSVLVNVRRLQEDFKTEHRIFVLVTEHVSLSYIEEFERFNVSVSVQNPAPLAEGSDGAGYYADCLLKLQGFRMHQIDRSLKRVIVMDSDQLILKNLDYLFEDQIDVDLAAPRAYWIAKETISTAFMMITLSDRLWATVDDAITNIKVNIYDMDLVNNILGDTVLMLPGSFVTLNSHWEDWNLPKWFHKTVASNGSETESNNTSKAIMRPLTGDLNKRDDSTETGEESNRESDSGLEIAVEDASTAVVVVSEEASEPITSEDMPVIPVLTDDQLLNLDSTNPDAVLDLVGSSKHEEGKSHYPDNMPPDHPHNEVYIPDPPLEDRKYYAELFDLYESANVLHFTALGKPWMVNNATLHRDRPEAHPLFLEQFLAWRAAALETCPTEVVTGV